MANIVAAESPESWRSLSESTRARLAQMDEAIRLPDKEKSFEEYIAFFSPGVVAHGMVPGETASKADLERHYHPVFFELKDGVILSDEIIVAGRMAAQRYHSLLYLDGEFDGVQAGGIPIFLRGQTFFRFDRQQLIIERWSNHDHSFRLAQMHGDSGREEGRAIADVLNGPGLSEEAVREILDEMLRILNLVQRPEERMEKYFDLFAPDALVHGVSSAPVPVSGLEEFYREVWTAFPDLEVKYEATLSAWSFGAIRWSGLGSHRGTYRGLASTRRPVRLSGEAILRFNSDGRVAEAWVNVAPVSYE